MDFGRKKYTVFEAISELINSGTEISFKEGVSFDKRTNFEETVESAKNSDIVILCVGEDTYTEFVGNINTLLLNNVQYELADALYETGKPIVLVYLGRIILKLCYI